MSKLTAKARKAVPKTDFVFPATRSFPIENTAHAVAALRLAGRVSPAKAAKVRAAVHKKYPNIGK